MKIIFLRPPVAALSVLVFVGCSSPEPAPNDSALVEGSPSATAASPEPLRAEPVGSGSDGAQTAGSESTEPKTVGHDLAVPLTFVAPGEPIGSIAGPARVQLAPGEHRLNSMAVLSGTNVTIFAPDPTATTLTIEADGGILFSNCSACVFRGVQVSASREATPRTAPLVQIERSDVTLQQCRFGGGDPEFPLIVAGSDGNLEVRSCEFETGGGTVLTAQSGAAVQVRGSSLLATGESWTSAAVVVLVGARLVFEENRIHNFGSGIRLEHGSEVEIRENVIENTRGVGIALSQNAEEPKGSRTRLFAEDNVFYRTGQCGAFIGAGGSTSLAGYFSKNAFVATNQATQDSNSPDRGSEECGTIPLVAQTSPSFTVENNLFHDNPFRPDPSHGDVLDRDKFVSSTMNLYTFHIEPQDATRASEFMAAFVDAWGPPFR